jgi:hypothetical protein
MFECFKSKIARMKKARRLTIESQRYQKIAGLLDPKTDDGEQFELMTKLVKLARSLENESCGCQVCAALRQHQRKVVTEKRLREAIK